MTAVDQCTLPPPVAAPVVTGSAPIPRLRGTHQRLPFREVRFEAHGAADSPAVLALGGISASAHLAAHEENGQPGWWEPQVGPFRALDPRRLRVIGMDYLGEQLRAGEPVPLVDTRDQAHAAAAVLDALGIDRLHALVGASYGGMVALAFAECYPARVERLVVVSAAHQPHPMATAVRAVQRRIVRDGVRDGRPREALAVARALAMTTYRTDQEFADRFGAGWSVHEGAARFAVEDYLDHCGRRYAEAHTAERFLCLSQSIDLHRVEPEAVRVPTTLVAVRGDPIAPPWQVTELATRLGARTRLHEIRSTFGHDGFLKEEGAIAAILTHALETEP
jgi:homoserine O-acetyltransferase